MHRSISSIVLILFIFSIFTPVLLQPKPAEAHCLKEALELGKQFSEILKGVTILYKVIKKGAKLCKEVLKKTCNACGKTIGTDNDKRCPGPSEKCTGSDDVPGCGNWKYPCEKKKKHKTANCKNKNCKKYGKKYRKCVGHTCENKPKKKKKKKGNTTSTGDYYSLEHSFWFGA